MKPLNYKRCAVCHNPSCKHELQTVMMLVTGKALNEAVAEIFDQGDEEVDDVER